MTDHRIAMILEFAGGMASGRSRWRTEEWFRVLRMLDPVDGRVLVLRYLHGLELAEIGERLDVTRGRIYQRLIRIHRKLRPLLERETVAA